MLAVLAVLTIFSVLRKLEMMFKQRSIEHELFYSKFVWRIFDQKTLE
jgi:hypothetical protein